MEQLNSDAAARVALGLVVRLMQLMVEKGAITPEERVGLFQSTHDGLGGGWFNHSARQWLAAAVKDLGQAISGRG